MYGAPPPGGYGAPPPGGYGAPPPYGPPPGWMPPGAPGPALAAPNAGDPFPPRLGDAPRDRRIDETFGWFPGAVAVGGSLGIVGALIDAVVEGGFDSFDQLRSIGIAALLVVLFGFWEIWRRTHPTSLVVTADRIGIYRKGQLENVVGHGQLTWYRLAFTNTFREYILFGMAGLGGLLGAPAAAMSGQIGGAMWSAAVGIGGCLSLASTIWSRNMCLHYYVPKGGGTETVVLRKSELRRLGSWAFPV